MAAEIGFDLVDTSTGGGSDGNFTAPHTATLDGLGVDGQGAHTHYEQMYISSIEPGRGCCTGCTRRCDDALHPSDTGDRDAPPDDGAVAHTHGSFFGRRKGHKLRIHQADLIDNLLPHLALDIGTPAPDVFAELFECDIDDVRLEIGFGGGEHLIAEAQAFPESGSSAASLTSTAWRRS